VSGSLILFLACPPVQQHPPPKRYHDQLGYEAVNSVDEAYLTDPDRDGKVLELIIEGNHEPRVHSRYEVV
jgi:hypothetical protein